MAKTTSSKKVEAILHTDAKRANIPTAEYQSMMSDEDRRPLHIQYEKRNPDLDPQLIWRGKYDGDDTLTVSAPPLYIQEKVHPKTIIEDLMRESRKERNALVGKLSLFSDFNGIPAGVDKTDFYKHEQNWTNRMILGDSLQVMASLAEREGIRGQVQCIYMDPPYGIKFNSNFQWSTTSRDVKDGKLDNMTREPEQVKAFRDTWKDGIHSYLSYLRDRFLVARDLLTESGSIFVQIGDENVHRVRSVMDEVFGENNFISQISIQTTTGFESNYIGNMSDFILWYTKDKSQGKYHAPFYQKEFVLGEGNARWIMLDDFSYRGITASEQRHEVSIPKNAKPYKPDNIISQGRSKEPQPFPYQGKIYDTWEKNSHWKANYPIGMERLGKASRIHVAENSIQYIRYHSDFNVAEHGNIWSDTGSGNFTDEKMYIVQTNAKVIQRCILMTTDPGDLVLDPTCGSGTTAYVAEQWGRRWITIDTSRVALALARARIMGARYPYYLMADSQDGQIKEAELRRCPVSTEPTFNNIKLGFVYERVPHITLKSIANNAEIDVIYDKWQKKLEPLREQLNSALGKSWEEWEIPRDAEEGWPKEAALLHSDWWKARIARQQEIDASISALAECEFLYDNPYEDKNKVRVAGPFTVESLSPHRVLGVGADGELLDPAADKPGDDGRDFVTMILDNLKIAGVQQSHKEDKIDFTVLTPWPGEMICAEGRYMEGDTERRAGIFIGPEFGTVSRQDLVQAAREVADAGFDLLIACAFNYEAAATEFGKLGKVPVLKARMNADLHMSEDLKATSKGNLFVVFGEPDISIIEETDTSGQKTGNIKVQLNGVDVFYPNTGEIRSDNTDGIACWFVDTDYNEESFFVRQAYFLGASSDPYKALKTSLKAEIDKSTWESLCSSTSRAFPRPANGTIAVKVINHLGDEVMKVFRVE
ncbi:MAG: site-specific DNA-methyltransferase [Mailhella sp.]|nr:site-specific DNA-methyltransferase [Mailhella sp.]